MDVVITEPFNGVNVMETMFYNQNLTLSNRIMKIYTAPDNNCIENGKTEGKKVM